MTEVPQVAWHGRYHEALKALAKAQADTAKEIEALKEQYERSKAHFKKRADSKVATAQRDAASRVYRADTRARTSIERAERKAFLELEDLKACNSELSEKLRCVVAVLEECAIPSPYVEDSRQQILAVLKAVK